MFFCHGQGLGRGFDERQFFRFSKSSMDRKRLRNKKNNRGSSSLQPFSQEMPVFPLVQIEARLLPLPELNQKTGPVLLNLQEVWNFIPVEQTSLSGSPLPSGSPHHFAHKQRGTEDLHEQTDQEVSPAVHPCGQQIEGRGPLRIDPG